MHELLKNNIARKIQLSEAEFERFLSYLKPKTIRKRDFLLQEGEVCRFVAFVERGILRSYSVDQKGEERIVQFAPEDWWVGDVYSSLTGKPSHLNIDAIEDSELLMLSIEAQEQLFEAQPKFERYFRLLMQNRFIALQERIYTALNETAEEKYRRFLEKYPSLPMRVPQLMIASYLGVQPETLSRVRKKWSQQKPPGAS